MSIVLPVVYVVLAVPAVTNVPWPGNCVAVGAAAMTVVLPNANAMDAASKAV
jgi:hypothetical protein